MLQRRKEAYIHYVYVLLYTTHHVLGSCAWKTARSITHKKKRKRNGIGEKQPKLVSINRIFIFFAPVACLRSPGRAATSVAARQRMKQQQ